MSRSESVFKDVEQRYKEQKARDVASKLGLPVKEVYGPHDIDFLDYRQDSGDPGEYPFTRGIHPNMYRGRLWTMRELVGFGTPADTARRIKELAREGLTGLDISSDTCTYFGLDTDHPLAEGITYRGVATSTLKDMEVLLEDIPLQDVSVVFPISTPPAAIVFAQYVTVAQKRGLDISKLRGTIQNEPLKGRYSTFGPPTEHFDLDMKLAGDVIEYCIKYMPLWNPINVQGACFSTYYLTEPETLGIVFSIAMVHINEALRRGLDIDSVAPRFAFFMSSHLNLFEQVASFRAARRIWAKIIKERYKAKSARSCMWRFSVMGAGHDLYPQEVTNNIVRITLQTLAAVMGGVQSIQGVAHDEPVSLPTRKSHRTALRIQQIVAFESGVATVADPLGGSYYVEYLTRRTEEMTFKMIKQIEEKGGILGAIESGWLDGYLEESCIRHQQKLDSGEEPVVGVNQLRIPEENDEVPEVHRISEYAPLEELDRLRETKASRNYEKVKEAVDILYRKAKERKENLIPFILEAVKAYATTGEIFGTIQMAFGYDYDCLKVLKSPFQFA